MFKDSAPGFNVIDRLRNGRQRRKAGVSAMNDGTGSSAMLCPVADTRGAWPKVATVGRFPQVCIVPRPRTEALRAIETIWQRFGQSGRCQNDLDRPDPTAHAVRIFAVRIFARALRALLHRAVSRRWIYQ